MRHLLLPAVLLMLFTAGCTLFSSASEPEPVPDESSAPLAFPEDDLHIATLLDEYRDSLEAVTGQRVATIHDTLKFDRPESPLGNLVADALRFRAGHELRRYVHIGVIGEISFRLFLTPGELTRGQVIEFMPYDNNLSVLTLSGEKVEELAHQIAAIGGAPVSGLRFRIVDGRARGILVNSNVLDRDAKYLLATSSWVAGGGDQFPAIWDYTDRIDLDVDVQQLYIDYFQNRREIYPVLDGRIRE
jgi:2',3'-cyclic-nucleotide 2'-phosphodiesterase (5'-nucleotidase family)